MTYYKIINGQRYDRSLLERFNASYEIKNFDQLMHRKVLGLDRITKALKGKITPVAPPQIKN